MREIFKSFTWMPIVSHDTGELTNFKHYVSPDRHGRAEARCGMVWGRVERGFFAGFFKRRCLKCRVSEKADQKKRSGNASC